ncbi:MAG: Trm112 family protein [Candidatus Aenigmarchaeota archaeon]|nr:Trm112 family protein [Candidatus Aenigmarchaeota archaeon]
MLSRQLLDVIACPKCKGNLEYRKDLFCRKCRLKFKVEDDIPNMLLEEAERF